MGVAAGVGRRVGRERNMVAFLTFLWFGGVEELWAVPDFLLLLLLHEAGAQECSWPARLILRVATIEGEV